MAALSSGTIPPVSTTSNVRPCQVAIPKLRSRVIPGSLVTIERRVPVSLLKIVDFPTFGRPTITTDGSFSVIGGHNEPYARGSEASTVSYRTPKQKLRGFHASRPLFAR